MAEDTPVVQRLGVPAIVTLPEHIDAPNAGQIGAPAAGAANTAQQAPAGQDLLDRIVHGLLGTGLSLQAAINMPGDVARQHITAALQRLDDTIRGIRDHVLTHRAAVTPPRPSDGDR